jgi:hypothetical protein
MSGAGALAPIQMGHDALLVGQLRVSFHRTLRVPDDGVEYPLPPSLGRFPLRPATVLEKHRPADWSPHDFFLSIYQREAVWIGFSTMGGPPCAVQVGVGGVNALSGQSWHARLESDPQNYLVCPDQPWLDGIVTASGVVRQFLAVPTGAGYTVGEQLPGADVTPGLHLRVYPPRPERLAEVTKAAAHPEEGDVRVAAGDLGVGGGGRMRQRVYLDRYGLDVWDLTTETQISVHLVLPERYSELTGEKPPPTPITAQAYTEAGLPWFDLDDENATTLPATEKLTTITSVREVDHERTIPNDDEELIQLERGQIKRIQRQEPPPSVDETDPPK